MLILQQAAILFREKGYKAASMKELGERLGIEAPSLYNHIGSKAELLQMICEDVAGRFMEQLAEVESSGLDSEKKMEKLIRFHIRYSLKTSGEVYVANNEFRHLEEESLQKFLQDRKNYERRFTQLLKTGIHQSVFRKQHPQVAMLTLLSALRGVDFIQKYKMSMSNRVLENAITSQLLKGILA